MVGDNYLGRAVRIVDAGQPGVDAEASTGLTWSVVRSVDAPALLGTTLEFNYVHVSRHSDLSILTAYPPMPLLPGEQIGLPPTNGDHAEQRVEDTFSARGVDKSFGVCIGSDPKACAGNCTPRYRDHSWARHERPRPGGAACPEAFLQR